jgi:predicted DNA-binding transcriptional regulator AlpA
MPYELNDFDNSRLIDKRQLLKLVPISYSSIWDLMRQDQFPLSVRIGSRVYWRAHEVEKWLAALPRSKYAGKSEPRKRMTGADQ